MDIKDLKMFSYCLYNGDGWPENQVFIVVDIDSERDEVTIQGMTDMYTIYCSSRDIRVISDEEARERMAEDKVRKSIDSLRRMLESVWELSGVLSRSELSEEDREFFGKVSEYAVSCSRRIDV